MIRPEPDSAAFLPDCDRPITVVSPDRFILSAEPDDPAAKARKRPRQKPLDGFKAPSAIGKNFVLDTNVLLHDPECLAKFGDNHICIPLDVVCELDRFKGEQTERGRNARSVHRTLAELFVAHPTKTAQGIPTASGGSIRFVTCNAGDRQVANAREQIQLVLPEADSTDHRILLCAEVLSAVNPAPVILVTKDLNLQLKALALGIPCEDYESDKVDEDSTAERLRSIAIEAHDLQRFASTGKIELREALAADLAINEYVQFETPNLRKMPARHAGGGCFVRLEIPESIRVQKGTPIRPLNVGQQCLIDALMDPSISLVTCFGQAGTGKTLVAVATAMYLALAGEYAGVTVSRPVVPLGDTLGFLPGGLDEKLSPWLQPIFDALEFILSTPPTPEHAGRKPQVRKQKNRTNPAQNGPAAQGPAPKVYQRFIDSGLVEVEALCYIRGRSIPKRFFILDEAQQLTPLEAKTIVTRMAQGSKLVLIGDPAQIDNAYVDRRSNGLVYTREKLKGQPCVAHVTLERGERSPLAEAGACLM